MDSAIREPAVGLDRYQPSCIDHANADLASLLCSYNIISFDVFDTLLIRPVATPVDAFEFVGRYAAFKNFCKHRVTAEARARNRKLRDCGHEEVSLDEIYKEMRDVSAERLAELRAAELMAERRFLRANPAIRPIYEMAAEMGKTIVAVSDMYLPASFVKGILREANLPVAEVFVSGDVGYSKRHGTLFDHVASTLRESKDRILHIGDNFDSDFKSPLKKGCAALHTISNNDQLFRDARCNQVAIGHLMQAKSNLFASLVVGHIAEENAATPAFSIQELFGRMYAGPMLYAFARWIEQMRTLDGVSRLYLLARDGHAVAQVLDALGSDAQRIILPVSRRMVQIATLEQDFDQVCHDIAESAHGATVREAVVGLELSNDIVLLRALGGLLDVDQKVTSDRDILHFCRALRQCREMLVEQAREEALLLKKFLEPLRLADPDCAIVDSGWALTTHRRLEMLLGRRMRGYYLGSSDRAYDHDLIKSFLFEKKFPSGWKTLHLKAVELLELPFIAEEQRSIRMKTAGAAIVPLQSNLERLFDEARRNYTLAIRRESLKFTRKIGWLSDFIRTDEMADTLEALFASLIDAPTNFEYFGLRTVPHVRQVGVHNVGTIGDYWHCHLTSGTEVASNAKVNFFFYFRLALLSLHRDGCRVTWRRITKKLNSLGRKHLKRWKL